MSAAAATAGVIAGGRHSRYCEELTGRANARPMTGSATKQSISPVPRNGLLRFARNDEYHDSAGRTAGAGLGFGPQRVNITLTHDSTPSNTMEAAASLKKS
jgi:hypothetical protein